MSRSDNVKNVIRINATSIDVTSSNAISFGYTDELARAGRVIAGRHRLEAPLPDPTSGKVTNHLWLAESAWHEGPVLVELLDPAIAEDAGLAETFECEARAAAAVSSPFVNRVLDFGVERSTPYLVSELPAGESLAARIARGERLTLPELDRMLREVALALDEMHGLGLLHRDLRSPHIFLPEPGTSPAARAAANGARLSFGIPKLMNDTLELVRTMARRSISPADTPRYSSPEQVLGTSAPDERSDLWSLAVIAFECVTLEMPFAGVTMAERLVQICTGQPRLPSQLCAVPRGFDEWFARGVEKAPADRWPSALQMSDALSALLEG